jgi:hypothetical protein
VGEKDLAAAKRRSELIVQPPYLGDDPLPDLPSFIRRVCSGLKRSPKLGQPDTFLVRPYVEIAGDELGALIDADGLG